MINRIVLIILMATITSCSSWTRIGDLTAVGNRNVDDGKKYSLLTREVTAKASADKDALEQAVDKLTQKYQGEFLRNVKIYVNRNGKDVKVIGDVWGIQNTLVNVTTEAKANVELNVGDGVVFNRNKKITEGRIIGINARSIIVEYSGSKKIELKYDDVTKTNK